MHLPIHLNPSFQIACCLLLVATSLQQRSIGNGIDDPNRPPALQDWVSTATSQSALSSSLVTSSSIISRISTSTQTISTPKFGGLTAGAKAGIGIGAALGVVLIIGIVVFAFRRRWRSSGRKSGAGRERFEKAELDGHDRNLGTKSNAAEIDGKVTKLVELGEGEQGRVELEGKPPLRSELA